MRALVVLLLLAPAALAPAQAAPSAWWASSAQDRDGDRIDDALAALPAGSAAVLLVSFARVPTASDLAALREAGFPVLASYEHFDVAAIVATPAEAPRILQVPGVVFVESDMPIERLLRESVPLIGAPQAWKDYGVSGSGIAIAVLDDGAFEDHPDLDGKVAGRFDAAVTDAASPLGLELTGARIVPAGAEGHGTHVAATIVGSGAASDGTYRGVAPEAQFVDVKVFSGPERTSSSIVLRGLDWTLTHRDELGVRIVAMSLGGSPTGGTDALSRAVDAAVEEGLIVVVAAGNNGPEAGTIGSPASAANAITVGAVDKRKAIASYSSRGPTVDGRPKPDLVAPGSAIVSAVSPVSITTLRTVVSGGSDVLYGELSGTSMAAPHVAGTIALMLEANPELTPNDVKRILSATAQDLGPAGRDDDHGYGFVNAIAAVQVARDPELLGRPQFAAVLGELPADDERGVPLQGAALLLLAALGAALLTRRAR